MMTGRIEINGHEITNWQASHEGQMPDGTTYYEVVVHHEDALGKRHNLDFAFYRTPGGGAAGLSAAILEEVVQRTARQPNQHSGC